MRLAPAFIAVLVATTPPLATGDIAAQDRRPLTFDDYAAVKAVSDPQLSPDGRSILYAVRTTDVEANRRITVTMLASVAGGAARQFPDDTTRAVEARWSPDGQRVAYISAGQLWVADAGGTNRRQLTRLTGGASGPVWAPTGDRIAFTSAVYPDCRTDECNAEREKAKAESKVKARIADQLMYRHWNVWDEGTRSHLFIVAPDGGGLRDVTEGLRYDVPPPPFGGSEAYAFSTDGAELSYTAKDQGREEAWSTDVNLYVAPVSGGPATVITAGNKGADQNPVYSPDGRYIAYASQERAGFESDRWRLMFYDRAAKQSREVLAGWDRNADLYFFSPGGEALYVMTQDRGRDKLFRAALGRDGRAAAPAVVVGEGNNTAFSLARDGRTLVWLRDAAHRPHEVYVAAVGCPPGSARRRQAAACAGVSGARQLTHLNDALVARLQLHPLEEYWFRGAGGDSVHGFVLRPPQWEAGKRFPIVLLVHGGPQGAWLDTWHSRWNYQMFAAPGFGLIIVNPRGSTGYGQRFVNEVTRDWSGKVYADLLTGLDEAVARHPVARLDAPWGCRGLVRRVHGQLDRGPLEPLRRARFARRSLQPRGDGRCHRGAVVHRMGVRRPVVGLDRHGGAIPQALSAPFRAELPHTDPRAARRARLPRAVYRGALDVHRAAAAGCAEPARRVPGRGALDPQAAEPAPLVGRSARVAPEVPLRRYQGESVTRRSHDAS
jgi:dipeptidyl aminopeptidase/acylaminoacyl peptidase